MLTSASYCAIKVHLGFSKPDLFNHCLLLQTPRVCMDTLFPQHWQCPGTPCSSLLVAVMVFGTPVVLRVAPSTRWWDIEASSSAVVDQQPWSWLQKEMFWAVLSPKGSQEGWADRERLMVGSYTVGCTAMATCCPSEAVLR